MHQSKQPENEVIPGDLVTPPCQGRYRHVKCEWFPTAQYGKLWLCEVCAAVWLNSRMVRRIKDKLRRQQRRVTE